MNELLLLLLLSQDGNPSVAIEAYDRYLGIQAAAVTADDKPGKQMAVVGRIPVADELTAYLGAGRAWFDEPMPEYGTHANYVLFARVLYDLDDHWVVGGQVTHYSNGRTVVGEYRDIEESNPGRNSLDLTLGYRW